MFENVSVYLFFVSLFYCLDILQKKLDVVSKMNFKDINHGVPFLTKSEETLKRIQNETLIESTLFSHDNRLYYLSEKIKVVNISLAYALIIIYIL